MITLKFSDLEFVANGGYGYYYRIKGTNKGFKGMKPDLWQGPEKEASREYKTLCQVVKRTKMAPKPYTLAKVKFPENHHWEGWMYGYVMEHINGEHNATYENLQYIEKRLKRVKIEHADLHGRNVLVTKHKGRKRYRVIDFGCVSILD